jgi:hypothetical protein
MSASQLAHSVPPIPGDSTPLLYNLVYCSRAKAGLDDAAVDRIVQSSHRRNPERGITGLLVFGSGIFFQWLEGPRDHVTALMAYLKTDPRHENVLTLRETEDVRERLFPNWDMERVATNDIRDVLGDALDLTTDERTAAVLNDLLAKLDDGGLQSLAAA